MSNFLGEVRMTIPPTSILSAAQLIEREGLELHKSMNFRDKGALISVILVLPKDDGTYADEWRGSENVLVVEGHDSVGAEGGGKDADQMLMYTSGIVTENGKFFKAAHAYKDRVRDSALEVQVYEKLDSGAWFDKGMFDLVDAERMQKKGRLVFGFHLKPWGSHESGKNTLRAERMIHAGVKAQVWAQDNGRCATCGSESALRFMEEGSGIRLQCMSCRGEGGGMLG